MRGLTLVTISAFALIGCADNPPVEGADAAPPPTRSATATLHLADGTEAGRATVRETPGGLHVMLDVHGLRPGVHGAHLHTIGRCDPPDFASAGGHWNPTGMKHGSMNPQGPHEGDLPNLTVAADGRGALSADIAGARFDSLIDADGAVMVVHADPDDLKTDPAGNSGGRIACGVLTAG